MRYCSESRLYIQAAHVVVRSVRVYLSLFVFVILSLELKGAALIVLNIFSSLVPTFVILQCARHLCSNLHSISHFPPAAIIVPHQEASFFSFDFLYDAPGDLYLCIRRFEFGVFFVSRFDQTTEHDIPGMTQIGVFASKDDIVHVWAINREVNGRSCTAFGIRIHAIDIGAPQGFEIFSNPNPLEEIFGFDVSSVGNGNLIHWDSISVEIVLNFHGIPCKHESDPEETK